MEYFLLKTILKTDVLLNIFVETVIHFLSLLSHFILFNELLLNKNMNLFTFLNFSQYLNFWTSVI